MTSAIASALVVECSPFVRAGDYGCYIWACLVASNIAAVFLCTADPRYLMEQTEKIAILLGRIEQMQQHAVSLRKELDILVEDLSLLKKSLGNDQSPFGVVYPHQ